MRIAHLILSDGFAGSERSTIESCNFQCREHEVLLVVRRGHRSRAGASIVDHVDPRVRVAVVPDRLCTRKALARELAWCGPDVTEYWRDELGTYQYTLTKGCIEKAAKAE